MLQREWTLLMRAHPAILPRILVAPALLGVGIAMATSSAMNAGWASAATEGDSSGVRPIVPSFAPSVAIDSAIWTDHDARPIYRPAGRDPNGFALHFREMVVEELSGIFDIPDKLLWALQAFGVEPKRSAANMNAFDEVPNSTWFTNRNHVRALSPREIREGPFGPIRPTAPWTITAAKEGGATPGFWIKDANHKRWLIKLDASGYPQASSGASAVSGRLTWAAGYNFSHDEAVTFRLEGVRLDDDLRRGKDGARPFTEEDLGALLAQGARASDGRYYAAASLSLPGSPIGPFKFRGRRSDDPNDWYEHEDRRELRGLFVFNSWINNWDLKDLQTLDMFDSPDDSIGHVVHYLLDAGSSLGAQAEGPKRLSNGYEQFLDFGWIWKRLFTLGFAVEPWRRAHQETGIPSVGNFEAAVFEPQTWQPRQYTQAFREMDDPDAYWGAKLVASFSNDQIAAAIDAVGYEDPRAPAYLLKTLAERRDKVARYWFGRVAPLDFFHVREGSLRFHDLAVDIGLVAPRAYEVEFDPGNVGPKHVMSLREAALPLGSLPAAGEALTALSLRLSPAGSNAKPVRVDLERRNSWWVVTRVRH